MMKIFRFLKPAAKSRFTKVLFLLMIISFISISFSKYGDKDFELAKNLDIYHTLFRELNVFYVDDIDPGKLIKKSIDEMLESLDPYTDFIPESRIEDYKMMFTGEYGGIGALIRQKDNKVVISEPYENFAAHKAGLKAGDIILNIDGNSVEGKSSAEISKILKNQISKNIKIEIERPGISKHLKFEFERENIRINNVAYFGMIDNIAYIKVTGFTQKAGKEVKDAFNKLKKDNDVKSVILDLRGNPGGLLIEAVKIVNVFVERGKEIVSTKGKVKQWNKTYKTMERVDDPVIPLAVIVNRQSASASEIVAGSLQDLDRAVIIGQRTYGKGLVQTTRKLSYNNQLKLTTAKYYIPSGRCIQALDYSHRNEDGSVGKIPDSLISEYTTKNGRKFYDGGGINPDIITTPKRYSNLTASLMLKSLIFDFATQFVIDKETIPPAETFSISDEEYVMFVEFISDKKYDYQTDSEKEIEKLVNIIKKENKYDDVEIEIISIKKKIQHNNKIDLQKYKNEIIELINAEIASRFYFQKGRVISHMKNDEEINKAVQVLSSSDNYKEILNMGKL